MARDARLSILTAQEVDELYRLPRFTEADRGLYFDLSTAELKLVDDVVTLSVAVHRSHHVFTIFSPRSIHVFPVGFSHLSLANSRTPRR
jgi:hypothetical protein